MSDDLEVIILGRKIGTASGWDEQDPLSLAFHDFIPSEDVLLEKCASIFVNYSSGVIEGYNDAGDTVIFTKDAVEVIKNLPNFK